MTRRCVVLVTEQTAHTFPRLPVRTGENVVAVITSHPDEQAHRRHLAGTTDHPLVRDEIRPAVEQAQSAAPRLLRLTPTARSLARPPAAGRRRAHPPHSVQGWSFSGLRTAQMCVIRPSARPNAATVTVVPPRRATRPGRPLTELTWSVMPGAMSPIATM